LPQPAGLRPSSGSGVAFLVAIFDRHLPAFHCAAAASPSSADLSTQHGKLLL
jgi:hypothetical protein